MQAINEDIQTIEAVVRGYFDTFASKDIAMLRKLVHPDLAKRQVQSSATGEIQVSHMSASTLIELSTLYGAGAVPANAKRDIRVLEIYGNMATAIGITNDYHDYLHLAKIDGTWQIVNVLWAMEEK